MANSKVKLKDKKVVIYKKITYRDSAGFQTTAYMPIHPQPSLWAYFKQLSADLLYASNTVSLKEECYFRVNYMEYLKTAHTSDLTLSYNNKMYQITRVDPYEGYKRDLALYCKVTNSSVSPIVPYDPTKL